MSDQSNSESKQPQFTIQGIYLRHLSLETSSSPVLRRIETPPEMKLELRVNVHPVNEQDEVVLDLTITARESTHLLYLMKIQQAGCFMLKDFTAEQKTFFLNTTCPTLLYPYASQMTNTLAVQAGFPPVHLVPIDFTQMYQQQQQQAEPSEKAKSASTKSTSDAPVSATKNKWAALEEHSIER